MNQSGDDEQTLVSKPSGLDGKVLETKSCLVTIYGPDLGRQHPLGNEETSIGRGPENDIVIDLDNVSRRHARVVKSADGFRIEDLESTNGTYVNDREIESEPLRHGDLVKIGGAILKFLRGGNIEALFHEEIYTLAIRDGLTQIHNKRFFNEFLDREMSRCARFDRPLSLIVFDIDHFKQINDVHGHLAGDHVLRRVAEVVEQRIRKEQAFARYGGEEFAIILPETPLPKAKIFAQKIRTIIESTVFDYEGRVIEVSVSLGVAEMGENRSIGAFVAEADRWMYEAKRAGRNRVGAPD
jgi:diguanylate cyclase (GGDEF)-like protein